MTRPEVDEVWIRRSDGKAAVRIGRVWDGFMSTAEDTWVRCHPVRGGHWWFASLAAFLERYERAEDPV